MRRRRPRLVTLVAATTTTLTLVACGGTDRTDRPARGADTAFVPAPGAPLTVNLAATRQLGDSTWLVPSRMTIGGQSGAMWFSVDCVGASVGIVNGEPVGTPAGRAALALGGAVQSFQAFGGGVWEAVCDRVSRP